MWKIFNDDCLSVLYSQTFADIIKERKPIIVTDPPFNVGYHYNEYKDNMPEQEYFSMLEDVFGCFPFVVIHYPESIYKIAFQVGKFPQKVVSWIYNSNTAKQHRDIAFFDVTPNFNQVKQPYKNPTDKRIMRRIADGCRGGAVIRLVEYKPSKECFKRQNRTPVSNATRSDEQYYWHTSKRRKDNYY